MVHSLDMYAPTRKRLADWLEAKSEGVDKRVCQQTAMREIAM